MVKLDKPFYIYRHLRIDSGLPFYIGKGRDRRAWSKKSRNKYWHRIVNKYGYEVEIMISNLTEDEAYKKEIEFIALYRRLGYCSSNLSGGGNGLYNPTEEIKQKIKKALTGKKFTEERKLNISKSLKGRISFRKGKKLSEEHIEKLRIAHKGHVPWNKGKKGLQIPWNKGLSSMEYKSHYPNGFKGGQQK